LNGFAASQTTSIPIYLPDEIRLIKAETILRSDGSLAEALALINAVRTQTSGDLFGVHAGLPAYSGAVTKDNLLLEVYKQRCAELYLSGLKLEDTRRFTARFRLQTRRNATVCSTRTRTRNVSITRYAA
jgi:hypothetical protein